MALLVLLSGLKGAKEAAKDASKLVNNASDALEAGGGSAQRYGTWRRLAEETHATAVKQKSSVSCGPASAQMLLADRGIHVFQSNVAAKSGSVAGKAGRVMSSPKSMATAMNKLDATGRWKGGTFAPEKISELMGRGRSWMAQVYERGEDLAHFVVIDGVDDLGRVIIRDPSTGSRYRMLMNEFMDIGDGGAVYR